MVFLELVVQLEIEDFQAEMVIQVYLVVMELKETQEQQASQELRVLLALPA